LGDLPVPTTPSANLTPAGRAQEKLGWQLAIQSSPTSDLLAEAPKLGLTTLVANLGQPISKSISQPFGPALDDEQRSEVRIKLDDAALRLKVCALSAMPAVENDCRELFQFARRMGVDMFICDADPSSLGCWRSYVRNTKPALRFVIPPQERRAAIPLPTMPWSCSVVEAPAWV
jgi:hypothetical protein